MKKAESNKHVNLPGWHDDYKLLRHLSKSSSFAINVFLQATSNQDDCRTDEENWGRIRITVGRSRRTGTNQDNLVTEQEDWDESGKL